MTKQNNDCLDLTLNDIRTRTFFFFLIVVKTYPSRGTCQEATPGAHHPAVHSSARPPSSLPNGFSNAFRIASYTFRASIMCSAQYKPIK